MPGPLIPQPRTGGDWIRPQAGGPVWRRAHTPLPKRVSQFVAGLLGADDPQGQAMALGTPLALPAREARQALFRSLMQRLEGGVPLEAIPLDERKAALGMTETVYHGTSPKWSLGDPIPDPAFREFQVNRGPGTDVGIHVDPDPRVAGTAVSRGQAKTRPVGIAEFLPPEGVEYKPGASIMQLAARIENPLDVHDVGMWKSPQNWLGLANDSNHTRHVNDGGFWYTVNDPGTPPAPAMRDILEAARARNIPETTGFANPLRLEDSQERFAEDLLSILKGHGHDSIRYLNSSEGVGGPSYLLTDPSQLRMPWAQFDPRRAKMGDLLAGIAGGAAVAPVASHRRE